jgi:signal peptidase II
VRRGQAAPGASLITETVPPDQARPRSRRLLLLVGAVAGLVLVLDQVTKALVVGQLAEGEQRHLVGSVLQLHLTRNAGAAFSTATGLTWVLTVVAVAVVVVVVRVASRLQRRVWAFTLGLLLGGALGNLSDRLFRAPGVARGHVVDFLELPHWPIFNVADSAIVTAGALVVLLTLLGIGLDAEPADAGPAEDPDA